MEPFKEAGGGAAPPSSRWALAGVMRPQTHNVAATARRAEKEGTQGSDLGRSKKRGAVARLVWSALCGVFATDAV